jgi:predicted  nucleic acid-binding Zn-ribbon protein
VASQRSSYALVPAAQSLSEAHEMLTINGALLNASSELDQLRQENERLKIENEQLKKQLKELIREPNDRIGTLEEIIRGTRWWYRYAQKEIDLSAALSISNEANARQTT